MLKGERAYEKFRCFLHVANQLLSSVSSIFCKKFMFKLSKYPKSTTEIQIQHIIKRKKPTKYW